VSDTGASRHRRLGLVLAAALCCGLGEAPAAADRLVVPEAVERGGTLDAVYRFDTPATGHGTLDVEWRDADGRIVARRRIPLALADASDVRFTLDLRRAVAMGNRLTAHLSFDSAGGKGHPARHREADAAATFTAAPPADPWSDYQIIMWQPQTAPAYRALKAIGITAGLVHGDHSDAATIQVGSELGPILAADMRFYVENIATDLYSSYHRWWGGRPVNWRFTEAKQRYRENPLDRTVFYRDPSLSNEAFLDKIERRLATHVRLLRRYRPLYYCLGDETGVADLAAFWDFDISPPSLAAMRVWLKGRYGSLAALNREWDSDFSDWDAVEPMLTNTALRREDGNFAAWADFKEWMDVAFARALKAGTDAVHGADPHAVAAIEGGQIPGWGGYDYARLAHAVDAMELYDFGDNVEIVRSFNPREILLLTTSGAGPAVEHRVWDELLRGIRGLILWDERRQFVDGAGRLGPWGRAAAPYFTAIRDGLGGVLIDSTRHTDPIGILYSQESFRIQWLLDRRASGEDWTRRSSGTEYQDNAIRFSTRNFVGAIEHMGLQPRFVSSAALERGGLRDAGYRVLILPHTIALSQAGAAALRGFVGRGGVLIADGEPGRFDGHGRRREQAPLRALFAATDAAEGIAPGVGRAILLSSPDSIDSWNGRLLARVLGAAGIAPRYPLTHPDGSPVRDVETYSFDNGGVTILALMRDLPAAGGIPFSPPNQREPVVVTLPQPRAVYDMHAHRELGIMQRIPVGLDRVEPAILALSAAPPAPPTLSVPASAHLGDTVGLTLRLASGAAHDVVRLDVADPEGKPLPRYSGNIVTSRATAETVLPLALNDKPGTWLLRATDPLSGTSSATLRVEP
jgi:Beta-galactosidase